MFFTYHRLQLPALSPATNMIARLVGSKANNTRTSLRPDEPGRNSFKFFTGEPRIVSTNGRPNAGPLRAKTRNAANKWS